jgi:hypothetical protein
MNTIRRKRSHSKSSGPSRLYEGVPIPSSPGSEVPSIPNDLTDLPDEELMGLFSRYIAWQNYVAVKHVEAEIHEADTETALRYAEATGLVESWTGAKEDRVTVAKAERELDPDVRDARQAYDRARARRKMLGVLTANMERAAALISRELTRRVGREPVERRQQRWNP